MTIAQQLKRHHDQSVAAARIRYWKTVNDLAAGVKRPTNSVLDKLRDDLVVLGLTRADVERDVGAVEKLRRLRAVDIDAARARVADPKVHDEASAAQKRADAAVAEAKAAFKAAELESMR